MSWYQIYYACGHEGREQIYGKTSERQNRADWLGNNKVCKPCWIKGRAEADRKAALARAGIEPVYTVLNPGGGKTNVQRIEAGRSMFEVLNSGSQIEIHDIDLAVQECKEEVKQWKILREQN